MICSRLIVCLHRVQLRAVIDECRAELDEKSPTIDNPLTAYPSTLSSDLNGVLGEVGTRRRDR